MKRALLALVARGLCGHDLCAACQRQRQRSVLEGKTPSVPLVGPPHPPIVERKHRRRRPQPVRRQRRRRADPPAIAAAPSTPGAPGEICVSAGCSPRPAAAGLYAMASLCPVGDVQRHEPDLYVSTLDDGETWSRSVAPSILRGVDPKRSADPPRGLPCSASTGSASASTPARPGSRSRSTPASSPPSPATAPSSRTAARASSVRPTRAGRGVRSLSPRRSIRSGRDHRRRRRARLGARGRLCDPSPLEGRRTLHASPRSTRLRRRGDRRRAGRQACAVIADSARGRQRRRRRPELARRPAAARPRAALRMPARRRSRPRLRRRRARRGALAGLGG